MEDEEFYHMMLDDLERLERVHHHREGPPPEPIRRGSGTWRFAKRSMSASTSGGSEDGNGVEPGPHNPWISGITSVVSEAIRASIDAVASRVEGRRKSVASQ